MKLLLWSAAAGAAAMYFFDPELGPKRRAQARVAIDRLATRAQKVRARVEGYKPARRRRAANAA